MKKLFLGSLFMLGFCCMYAQPSDVSIIWGDVIPIAKGHKPAGFVGNKTVGYVQLSEDYGKSIGLSKLSADLKFENSDLREISAIKKASFDGVIDFGNKAYSLISGYNKEVGSDCLFAQQIDVKAGKFIGEPTLLITAKGEVESDMDMIPGVGYRITNRFKLIASENNESVLVYYEMRETKEDRSKPLNYVLFDNNLKEIWSYKSQEGHPVIRGGGSIFVIDNKMYEISTFRARGQNNSSVRILSYGLGDTHINMAEAPLEGMIALNSICKKIDNKKFMIAGYYSSISSPTSGCFTVIYNLSTNSAEKINNYPFKPELISAFESDRTKRKLEKIGGGVIPDLYLRNIVSRADGGYFVIGEQYSYKIVQTDNGSKTYNNYHDVIISSINSKGEELITVKIPKQQQFINNDYGSGLGCFTRNNNLYMFYLDNVANENLAEGGVPVEFRYFKDGAFVCIKMTPDGKITKSSLFDMKDENKTILPNGIDEVEPGILLSSGKRSQIISDRVNRPAMIKLN